MCQNNFSWFWVQHLDGTDWVFICDSNPDSSCASIGQICLMLNITVITHISSHFYTSLSLPKNVEMGLILWISQFPQFPALCYYYLPQSINFFSTNKKIYPHSTYHILMFNSTILLQLAAYLILYSHYTSEPHPHISSTIVSLANLSLNNDTTLLLLCFHYH